MPIATGLKNIIFKKSKVYLSCFSFTATLFVNTTDPFMINHDYHLINEQAYSPSTTCIFLIDLWPYHIESLFLI